MAESLVLFGVLLAVFGQFLGATSMLLMKRASVIEAEVPFFRRRLFQAAFVLFVFNTVVLDAAVYALAPLTIVAPITALGIVFVNIGVANGIFVEREIFGPRMLLANALIVAGLVAACGCGPHVNTTPTLPEMFALARAPAFLAYAAAGLTIALSFCLALWTGCLPPRSPLKTVWCALAAAVFGSLSVLCFKGVATVVRLAFEGDDQLQELGTWVLLLGAAVCAPANVTLMNLTFEISDANCTREAIEFPSIFTCSNVSRVRYFVAQTACRSIRRCSLPPPSCREASFTMNSASGGKRHWRRGSRSWLLASCSASSRFWRGSCSLR
jgi:hypothetical protein